MNDGLRELFERADRVGLSVRWIAAQLDVADSTVWRWLADSNKISLFHYRKITALVEEAEAAAELPPAAE